MATRPVRVKSLRMTAPMREGWDVLSIDLRRSQLLVVDGPSTRDRGRRTNVQWCSRPAFALGVEAANAASQSPRPKEETMFTRSHRTAAIGVLGALALATVGAAPAYAKDGRVEKRGACSSGSVWKLKAGPDNGAIETQFEVDSNRVGQHWNVAINDNGVRVFTGSRTTTAPSGSFEVARRIRNRAGIDHILAFAKNPATGETCVGRVSV